MNRILSYVGGVSILSILMFAMVTTVTFYLSSYEANAQGCDAWVDYFVEEDGHGTCTVGIGGDFLNGTGKANCAVTKTGRINCTCHGETDIPLELPLFFNDTDNCCISIGEDPPILSDVGNSDVTFGLGTPGGRVNANCKIVP